MFVLLLLLAVSPLMVATESNSLELRASEGNQVIDSNVLLPDSNSDDVNAGSLDESLENKDEQECLCDDNDRGSAAQGEEYSNGNQEQKTVIRAKRWGCCGCGGYFHRFRTLPPGVTPFRRYWGCGGCCGY